jgi:hypothetical protein
VNPLDVPARVGRASEQEPAGMRPHLGTEPVPACERRHMPEAGQGGKELLLNLGSGRGQVDARVTLLFLTNNRRSYNSSVLTERASRRKDQRDLRDQNTLLHKRSFEHWNP